METKLLTSEQFYRIRCAELERKLTVIEAKSAVQLATGNVNKVKTELGLSVDSEIVEFDPSALTITIG